MTGGPLCGGAARIVALSILAFFHWSIGGCTLVAHLRGVLIKTSADELSKNNCGDSVSVVSKVLTNSLSQEWTNAHIPILNLDCCQVVYKNSLLNSVHVPSFVIEGLVTKKDFDKSC